MNTALSFLISAGIAAFGVWIIACTIGAGSLLSWTLLGILPVVVGSISLFDENDPGEHGGSYWYFEHIGFGSPTRQRQLNQKSNLGHRGSNTDSTRSRMETVFTRPGSQTDLESSRIAWLVRASQAQSDPAAKGYVS
jgi:hypothetical protein